MLKDDLNYFVNLISQSSISSRPSFHLLSIAYWLQLKFQYDPWSVAAIGRVDPLPHQLSAFRSLINRSVIRVLIADDVGLGKTITVGLLLKEFILQQILHRCLIVVPASLQLQWQSELKEKFLIDAKIAEDQEAKFTFQEKGIIITSLQFARRGDKIELFEKLPSWDMVIFDEAHRLGGVNSYELAQTLSSHSKHLLLLTATPHDGKRENFVSRLRLLDPLIGESDSEIRDAVRRLTIRRIKSEVTDFHGQHLFPNQVITRQIEIDWNSAELEFYEQAEDYIENYFLNPDTLERYSSITFILLTLMRRLSSSLQSGQISLERRLKKLDDRIKVNSTLMDDNEDNFDNQNNNFNSQNLTNYYSAIEEGNEFLAEQLAEEISTDLEKGFHLLLRERGKLAEVIELSNNLLSEDTLDSKTQKLLEILIELRTERPNDKIIIFTEFTDTLFYLKSVLEENKYIVYTIYGQSRDKGQMKKEEKKAQELGFKIDGDILIGTEAAGEGLNLQFANIVINYELPWNPNRLQQRIGRVYRYGQDPEKPIIVINFTSTFSVEKRIISKLLLKIEIIRSHMGEIGVELLGNLISIADINQLIIQALKHDQSVNDSLDSLIEEKKSMIREILTNYLISNSLEPELIQEELQTNLQDLITPTDIEQFVLTALSWYNIPVSHLTDSRMIYTHSLPELRTDTSFFIHKPLLSKNIPLFQKIPVRDSLPIQIRFTFDKNVQADNIDYLALGHPLISYLMNVVFQNDASTITLAKTTRPLLFSLRIWSIYNETGEILYQEPLLEEYDKDTKKITILSPLSVWSYEILLPRFFKNITSTEKQNLTDEFQKRIKVYQTHVQEFFADSQNFPHLKKGFSLLEYKKNLELNQINQTFNSKITQTEQEIIETKNNRIEWRLKGLEERLFRLQNEAFQATESINKKYSKTKIEFSQINALLLGVQITDEGEVITEQTPLTIRENYNQNLKEKRRVELAGMQAVMEFEISHSRTPQDVSADYSLGYDILSVNKITNEERWIEVKSFKGIDQSPLLSSNELRVAQNNHKKFFLYVVYNATSMAPIVISIQDPFSNLKSYISEEQITSTMYRIDAKGINNYNMNL